MSVLEEVDEELNDDSQEPNAENASADMHRASASKTVKKLKRENEELLKDLPHAPLNNGNYYEEESAWRFHNPAFPQSSMEQLTPLGNDSNNIYMSAPVSPAKLLPIPPPPPLQQLPSTGYCTWSFDEDSRVLLANFRDTNNYREKRNIKVSRPDESFLFGMMERDDITVISEGLADSLDSSKLSREYIEGCIGNEYHHKYRGFETVSLENGLGNPPIEEPKEKPGWYSMKVSDYFQYLDQRQSLKNARLGDSKENESPSSHMNTNFSFTDSNGEGHSVNVDKESLVSFLCICIID